MKVDRKAGKLLENSETAKDSQPACQQKERRSVGKLACFSKSSQVHLRGRLLGQQVSSDSETKLGELLVELLDTLVSGGGLGARLCLLGLEGMEGGGFNFSLFLETLDDASLGPAGECSELAKRAEASVRLESERFEGIWHHHALLLIVGEGDSVEDLESAEGGGSTGLLVGQHAAGALPENARRGSPVLGTTARVGVDALLHRVQSNDLVSLQIARLEDLLAAHNGDALTRQQLLGNDACQTALKVASAVNDQLLFEHA